MSKFSDSVQGTLDRLILKILALEPLNRSAMSQRMKQVSGDVLQVSDGSLNPALHKTRTSGLDQAEWKLSENDRRAKFYSLSRLGVITWKEKRPIGTVARRHSPRHEA